MNSNFDFLQPGPAEFYAIARKAERYTLTDPEVGAIYCRKALEKLVAWMYENDPRLSDKLPAEPKDRTLHALTSHYAFKRLLSEQLNNQLYLLRKFGNSSVHDGSATITAHESTTSLKALYGFGVWFAKMYTGAATVPAYNEGLLPGAGAYVSVAEKEALRDELAQNQLQVQVRDELLHAREEEIRQLREQLEGRGEPLRHYTGTLTEAETRRLFIDVLLREAGWNPEGQNVREFSITPHDRADYVLWDDDGLPLAVVEAKRTTSDKEAGQQKAKRYADALESRYGRRPFLYYTNGFQTGFWDDLRYAPRQVQGFHKKSELQLLMNRRRDRLPLRLQSVNNAIADRYYQKKAAKDVSEHWEGGFRKALVVMATGSGKTRTAAAIVDLLVRANWVKRVLFLADRKALVRQAYRNFKRDLPSLTGVNLLAEPVTANTRLVFSTYKTIINRIDNDVENEVRFFGIGHFDLIIIDEAHRSIYNKYRAVFEYFDSLLLGLTATPKAETETDTFHFFDLPSHDPTYSYDLDQAVGDEYLVPYRGISVPMKFPRNGITYRDLPPQEQQQYEETFLEMLGHVPDGIDAGALNAWLFNQDTVDKVLIHLMDNGQKIEGGDKLGKTIIFAKSKEHARFIVDRFDILYPQYAGHFCRRIDYSVDDADKLIEAFAEAAKSDFQMAVSVDMLDTGIDIPEVLNLVFFKRVMSKAKFWQMIGRGTRLRPNLFAPAEPGDETRYPTYRRNPKHKQFFRIFDFCENFEFFEANPKASEGSQQKTLSERIFMGKLRLALAIGADAGEEDQAYKAQLLAGLHQAVLALPEDSFVVRRVMPQVLKYKDSGIWHYLGETEVRELEQYIAPLLLDSGAQETIRRFDHLVLQTQLARHTGDSAATALAMAVRKVARGLQKKSAIAAVSEKMPLITAVAGEELWQAATLTQLDHVRTQLRHLVTFLDREVQPVIYTNFEDEFTGAGRVFEALSGYVSSEVYKERVEKIIRANADHLTIRKLQHNTPITEAELNGLERMLFEGGEFDCRESFVKILGDKPLGVFIRSILGLDIQAAKAAFSDLLNGVPLNSTQSTFVNTIINYLNQNGTIDSSLLYQSPFTDIDMEGITGVFDPETASRIVQIIAEVNSHAKAG